MILLVFFSNTKSLIVTGDTQHEALLTLFQKLENDNNNNKCCSCSTDETKATAQNELTLLQKEVENQQYSVLKEGLNDLIDGHAQRWRKIVLDECLPTQCPVSLIDLIMSYTFEPDVIKTFSHDPNEMAKHTYAALCWQHNTTEINTVCSYMQDGEDGIGRVGLYECSIVDNKHLPFLTVSEMLTKHLEPIMSKDTFRYVSNNVRLSHALNKALEDVKNKELLLTLD
jgi:hypothetical protein